MKFYLLFTILFFGISNSILPMVSGNYKKRLALFLCRNCVTSRILPAIFPTSQKLAYYKLFSHRNFKNSFHRKYSTTNDDSQESKEIACAKSSTLSLLKQSEKKLIDKIIKIDYQILTKHKTNYQLFDHVGPYSLLIILGFGINSHFSIISGFFLLLLFTDWKEIMERDGIKLKLEKYKLAKSEIQDKLQELKNEKIKFNDNALLKLNTINIYHPEHFKQIQDTLDLPNLKCALCDKSATEVQNCKCGPILLWNDLDKSLDQ